MNQFQFQLKEALKRTAGQFMTITFVKQNGEVRTLNCKYGKVPGHDGHNTVSHIESYITVSLSKKDKNGKTQFRNINVESIQSISVGGMKIDLQKLR